MASMRSYISMISAAALASFLSAHIATAAASVVVGSSPLLDLRESCADGSPCDLSDDEGSARDVSFQLLQQVPPLPVATPIAQLEPTKFFVSAQPAGTSSAGNSSTASVPPAGNSSLPPANLTVDVNTTGVALNAAGDLSAFISGLIVNTGTVCFCLCVFMFLRTRYPIIYSNNVDANIAPQIPEGANSPWLQDRFGWLQMSLHPKLEKTAEGIGLDNAMMIEFSHLCMKIMATIGVPMICIIGPLNFIFGGHAAGDDHLSNISFGNVENGSWLYWVHAVVVWYVVLVVLGFINQAMDVFRPLRFKWLRSLPVLRANTIMVEGIPTECRSDSELREYFEKVFPGDRIKEVHITKDTTDLLPLFEERKVTSQLLAAAKNHMDKDPEKKRPTHRPGSKLTNMIPGLRADPVDSLETFRTDIEGLNSKIQEERKKIEDVAHEIGGVNLHNAFVTFHERADAEVALKIELSAARDEWVLSSPPEPSDLRWADLTQGENTGAGLNFLGYCLVGGLYCGYLPIVIGITNLANLADLGPLQPVWASVAPTLGLQFMVAMLPTILIMIFKSFFSLKADAWAQHRLQVWYFWFQVVFVILATSIGQNAVQFVETVLTDPLRTVSVLATTMPYATHFYMNFMVLQCVTHSMNMMRHVTLFKFKAFLKIGFEEEDAKAAAEPEDQDYYGLGSRSARWVISMLIGIIFSTLCPPITGLCFLHFAVVRVIYGYLIPFAETKKADLGGVFFVKMLEHLFIGCIIYCILMIGVFSQRASTYGPMIISIPPLVIVIYSLNKFKSHSTWETLPFEVVKGVAKKGSSDETSSSSSQKIKQKSLGGNYIQKELLEDLLKSDRRWV